MKRHSLQPPMHGFRASDRISHDAGPKQHLHMGSEIPNVISNTTCRLTLFHHILHTWSRTCAHNCNLILPTNGCTAWSMWNQPHIMTRQAITSGCDLFRNSQCSRRTSACSLCPQSRSSRQQTTAARQPALSRTRQGRSCYVMLPWHCNHDGTLAMNPDAWCIHVGEYVGMPGMQKQTLCPTQCPCQKQPARKSTCLFKHTKTVSQRSTNLPHCPRGILIPS